MKKLIAIALILTLAFALTACKETPAETTPEDTSSEQTAPITSEPTGNGDNTPETEEPIESPEPEKPVSSEEPASSKKPATSSKPATNPTSSQKPATSSKPAASSKPATSSKPTTSSKPQVTVKNEYFASNTASVANEVYIRPKHVYWGEDGKLHAESYVINGTAKTTKDFIVRSFKVFDSNNQLIASASFDARGMGQIPSNMNRVHTFTFGTDCILKPNATLSNGVYFEFEIGYNFG